MCRVPTSPSSGPASAHPPTPPQGQYCSKSTGAASRNHRQLGKWVRAQPLGWCWCRPLSLRGSQGQVARCEQAPRWLHESPSGPERLGLIGPIRVTGHLPQEPVTGGLSPAPRGVTPTALCAGLRSPGSSRTHAVPVCSSVLLLSLAFSGDSQEAWGLCLLPQCVPNVCLSSCPAPTSGSKATCLVFNF